MKKIIILLFVVFLLNSCIIKHKGVIIGVYRPSIAQVPIAAAISAKYIQRENVRYYSNYFHLYKLLESGSVDAAILPFNEVFKRKSKNIKFYSHYIRGGIGILGHDKINNLSDLSGKKVGVVKKTIGAYLIHSIKLPKNTEIVLYGSETMMKFAFDRGKLAAMVWKVPKIVEAMGRHKIIHWFSDDYSYFPYSDLMLNKNAYKEKKGEIDRILNQLIAVGDNFSGSPKLLFDTMTMVLDITHYRAKEISYHMRFLETSSEKDKNFEKSVFDFMKKNGCLKLQNFGDYYTK